MVALWHHNDNKPMWVKFVKSSTLRFATDISLIKKITTIEQHRICLTIAFKQSQILPVTYLLFLFDFFLESFVHIK